MKLILMRGASGSGKSYLAKQIQMNQGGIILSTDDLFMCYGEYLWSGNVLREAHQVNQGKAYVAMSGFICVVIIDNTNIRLWEMEPYIKAAEKFGYAVEYRESEAPWKNDAEACFKKNSHNVPLSVIEQQLANWEEVDE